jgi:hypothetical protein
MTLTDTRLSTAELKKKAKTFIKEKKQQQQKQEQETKKAEATAAKIQREAEAAARTQAAADARKDKRKRPEAAPASSSDPYGKPYLNRSCPSREQRYMQRGLIMATLARLEVESVCEAIVAGTSIPHATTFGTDPKGTKQMRAHRYAHLYEEALADEIGQVLESASVCVVIPPEKWQEIVTKDSSVQLLDSMVHFKMKFNPDGTFLKPKCRIVVRGDQQESGTAGETYAACPRRSSFRLLVALAAARALCYLRWTSRGHSCKKA